MCELCDIRADDLELDAAMYDDMANVDFDITDELLTQPQAR